MTSRLGAAADASEGDGAAHLRTLQSQVEAIARGDLAVVVAHACEDVTLTIFVPPEFPFVRSASGSSAFRDALAANFSAVADQKPIMVDVFAEGDKVVMFGRETGIIRATGVAYDVEFVQRFTFREGRLATVQIIGAHARQAGA